MAAVCMAAAQLRSGAVPEPAGEMAALQLCGSFLTWLNWSICTEQPGCQTAQPPLKAGGINAFANWTCCRGCFSLCFPSRQRSGRAEGIRALPGAPTRARRAGPETGWRRRIPLPIPSPCVAVGGEQDSSLGTEVGSTRIPPCHAGAVTADGPQPFKEGLQRLWPPYCICIEASSPGTHLPAERCPHIPTPPSSPAPLPSWQRSAGSGGANKQRFDHVKEMEAFARAHLTARGERRAGAGGAMVITACLHSLPHLAAELFHPRKQPGSHYSQPAAISHFPALPHHPPALPHHPPALPTSPPRGATHCLPRRWLPRFIPFSLALLLEEQQ